MPLANGDGDLDIRGAALARRRAVIPRRALPISSLYAPDLLHLRMLPDEEIARWAKRGESAACAGNRFYRAPRTFFDLTPSVDWWHVAGCLGGGEGEKMGNRSLRVNEKTITVTTLHQPPDPTAWLPPLIGGGETGKGTKPGLRRALQLSFHFRVKKRITEHDEIEADPHTLPPRREEKTPPETHNNTENAFTKTI